MTFVYISEQTVLISINNMYLFVFLTEKEYVYCAVQTESLNTNQVSQSL